MPTPEERLAELGLTLPEPPRPAANYLMAKRHGDTLHLAGHGPMDPDTGGWITGKVGQHVGLEQAVVAARFTALQLIATMRDQLGDLGRVTSVLKLLGMVNCAPGFNNTPAVINGASDLLVTVFGPDVGAHARSAVGMAELPFDICVEIEAVVSFS